MPRPAKALSSQSSHLTKNEIKARENTEEKLKGKNDKLTPSNYLNDRQKEIFEYILDNLEESRILGNLDIFVLHQTAICIERLESMEKEINKNIEVLKTSSYKSARDMYSKEFFRCCNELCLSPQSRAKLSISKIPKKEEPKTLKDLLGDDDE